jgi:hypothetical protein
VSVRGIVINLAAVLVAVALLPGCNERASLRRTLKKVGVEQFRSEVINICREGFVAGAVQKISKDRWPASLQAFEPMGLWAEPDGAYVLLDSDAGGERGIYLPRIVSEKDPLCGPRLTHEKLAVGVYWYDRKR